MALPIETVSKPVSEMTDAEMEIILFEAQKAAKDLKSVVNVIVEETQRRRNERIT
jgi:hypothetical protein|tara:strand:- start:1310 stop:1474 length:165 start_codon:yes stop_codon:yes gene_type:complete